MWASWSSLIVAIAFLIATAPQSECAGPDSPLELLQHQLPQARSRLVRSFVGDGVHHAAFVGEPRAWQESQAPLMRAALLHMWLRCMSDHVDLDRGQLRDLEIRGFLFVEPRNTQHINSPAAPLLQGSTQRFAPNVTALLTNGTRLRFHYTPPFIPANVPSSVRLRIPGTFNIAEDMRISLDGWPQYTLLSLSDCTAVPDAGATRFPAAPRQQQQHQQQQQQQQQQPQQQQQRWQPPVIIVSKNIYNQDMAFVSGVIAASLAYHAAIGVERWELYVTKAQAATMLKNAELRRLAREGRVGFITINSLAHYHKFLYAYQCIVYTHAALSHWGEDVRLLFTDYDEFVALPPKTSLQQLLARHGDSPIIYLTTHYVFNKQLNTAGNESAAWRAAAAAALQSGGPDSVEGRGKPGEFGGALAAATAGGSQPPGMLGQGALKQPVATYQGQSAPAVRAVGAMLRLLRGYTLRAGPSGAKKNQLGQVKSLVDPNVVDQVFIHTAHTFDPRGEARVAMTEGFIAEVYNIFHHRLTAGADSVDDEGWHWAVDEALADVSKRQQGVLPAT